MIVRIRRGVQHPVGRGRTAEQGYPTQHPVQRTAPGRCPGTAPSTRMPHRPRTTLGIAASVSTRMATGRRTARGASSVRYTAMATARGVSYEQRQGGAGDGAEDEVGGPEMAGDRVPGAGARRNPRPYLLMAGLARRNTSTAIHTSRPTPTSGPAPPGPDERVADRSPSLGGAEKRSPDAGSAVRVARPVATRSPCPQRGGAGRPPGAGRCAAGRRRRPAADSPETIGDVPTFYLILAMVALSAVTIFGRQWREIERGAVLLPGVMAQVRNGLSVAALGLCVGRGHR